MFKLKKSRSKMLNAIKQNGSLNIINTLIIIIIHILLTYWDHHFAHLANSRCNYITLTLLLINI